jgi:hypothetical protein
MRRFIVQKQDSTRTTEDESDITESYLQDTSYVEDTEEQEGGATRFNSIARSNYKKPSKGSKQDNMTKDEIKKKLVGYVPLRTLKEKKILEQMPLFKTWVRYINNETKQFRTGGLLMKVEYPKYVMLVNTQNNLSWSVQLDENIFFIRDPSERDNYKKERENVQLMKDKLYEMYKRGELKKNNR